jgi:hypothetical protein
MANETVLSGKKSPRLRAYVWPLVKITVSFGIIAYLLSIIPATLILKTIGTANIGLLVAAWSIFFSKYMVAAWMLRVLTVRQGITLATLELFKINLITGFYGLLLPGGPVPAGIVRWYRMASKDNKPAEALSVVLLNRLLDYWSLALVALGFWLLDDVAHSNLLLGTVLAAVFIGLSLLYVVSTHQTTWRLFDHLVEALPLIPEFVRQKLRKLSSSLSQFNGLGLGAHSSVLALCVIRSLLNVATLYCLALAIGIDLSVITIGWAGSLTGLLSILPITYAGLGLREASLIVLFEPYGISKAEIFSLSMLWFSGSVLVAACGGVLEARQFLRKRQNSGEKSSKAP